MNTILKKLLSGLCVMAMVLSMVPAMNLSNYTVETNAAETDEVVAPAVTDPAVLAVQQAAAEKYDAALQAVKDLAAEAAQSEDGLPTRATCPLCSQTVTWIKVEGTLSAAPYKSSTHNHLYLTGDVTIDNNINLISSGNSNYYNCVFTNGYDITNNNTYPIFAGNGKLNVVAMDKTGTDHSVIKGANNGGTTQGATVQSNGGGDGTEAHFYGGVYEKVNKSTTANVFGGSGNSMNYYFYNTTITAGTKGSAIYIPGSVTYGRSHVTIYSGKIDGSATSEYTIDIEAGRAISTLGATTSNGKKYQDKGYTVKLDMYGGEVIGGTLSAINLKNTPASSATTCGARASTFNLYDGTIIGGTVTGSGSAVRQEGTYTVTVTSTDARVANYKGNTYTATPVFNMSGGVIEGGTVGAIGETAAYPSNDTAKAKITTLPAVGKSTSAYAYSGRAGWGGSCYLEGEVNISGGIIRGGTASVTYATQCTCKCTEGEDGEPVYEYSYKNEMRGGQGGNIYATGAMTITGGTIENGTAYSGGNIYRGGSAVTIGANATLQNGTATYAGGNLYTTKSTTINGKLVGGSAPTGGSIYSTGALIIDGGTIDGGTSTGSGGAIYSSSTLTMNSGTIKGGVSGNHGGNIYKSGGSLTINGGTIEGGAASSCGGNINITDNATATITGGTIKGGTVKGKADGTSSANWGGNIRVYRGNLTITGGKIYDGKCYVRNTTTLATDGNAGPSYNIGFGGEKTEYTLDIQGGEINGGVYCATLSWVKAKFSGAPQILKEMTVDGTTYTARTGVTIGEPVDITGLTTDANILVSRSLGAVLTEARSDAEDVAGCFTFVDSDMYYAAKNTDDQLYVAEAEGIVVDADGNKSFFATNEEALADYTAADGSYVVLSGDAEIPADMTAVTISPAAGDVTVSAASENTTVTLIDTANKDFETCSGKVTAGANVTVTTGEVKSGDDRYITISETSGDTTTYTSHYVEMALKSVSLRTTADGLYYKVEIKCDETLAKRVKQFGVAVQLKDRPTELVDRKYSYQYTLTPNTEHTVTVNSLEVFGILKDANKETDTATRIETNSSNLTEKVYANLYLICDTDGVDGIEDGESIVWEKPVAEARGYSLCDVVERINANWDDLGIKPDSELYKNTMAFVERWNSAEQLNEEALARWQAITGNIK